MNLVNWIKVFSCIIDYREPFRFPLKSFGKEIEKLWLMWRLIEYIIVSIAVRPSAFRAEPVVHINFNVA